MINQIEQATDVLVILSPGSMDRCKNEGDWFSLEIIHAMECGKNVVPVFARDFQRPGAGLVPPDVAKVLTLNGLTAIHEMFSESIDRLARQFLNSKSAYSSSMDSLAVCPICGDPHNMAVTSNQPTYAKFQPKLVQARPSHYKLKLGIFSSLLQLKL